MKRVIVSSGKIESSVNRSDLGRKNVKLSGMGWKDIQNKFIDCASRKQISQESL